jgi:hypothetical protein
MLERGGEEVAQALINLTARLQVGFKGRTYFLEPYMYMMVFWLKVMW